MSNTIPHEVRAFLESIDHIPGQLGRKDISEAVKRFLAKYPEPQPEPVITSETTAEYGNETIRKHAELLVERDVFYCVSSLVDTVNTAVQNGADMDIDEDDIRPIMSRDDWEEPARDYIANMARDELESQSDYFDIEHNEEQTDDEMRTALVEKLDDTDDWQDFCDNVREDPHTIEAYEHWIVSSWMADQLEGYGEMVARDFLGLTIWGRATTGQSIAMDSVMLSIARDALVR